jgi:hypothetical protein
MSIQKRGITESTTKKNVQNISFNYRPESDLSAIDENALSKYKMIDSITNVFDTLPKPIG